MARKHQDLLGLEREEAVRKQKTVITGVAAAVIAVAVLVLCLAGQRKTGGGGGNAFNTEPLSDASVTETPVETPAPAAVADVTFPSDPAFSRKITILGTGDNLIHEALYEDAESENEAGYYDFRPMYELVKPYIEAADLATVNMETPLATSIGDPAGYPHFNSPRGAGYVLMDSGFDVINHANNHIMDMGTEGVRATLDYWAGYDMPVVGAYRNTEDLHTMRILERNGITVAFLGIAEFLNYELPEDTSIRIPFFNDPPLVEELIRQAKEEADVVVVHAHWGEENEDILTDTMREMSQRMVDWGADIIFGNHTHIVQKLDVLTRESDGQLCPVLYSNGNFISGQKERAHLLSGLEYVTVAKNPDTGEIQIEGVQYLPVITHYEGDRQNVRVYPLDQYSDELAAQHGVKDFEGEPMSVEYLWDLIEEHIPREFQVTTGTLALPGETGQAGDTAEASEYTDVTGSTAEAGGSATEAAAEAEAAEETAEPTSREDALPEETSEDNDTEEETA